jgi:quercetin dioxygenase-like cupin family protein
MKISPPGAVALMTFAAVATLVPPSWAEKDEPGFKRVRPEEVQWKDAKEYKGLQIAVIEGDPSKPGIYILRVKFPAGLMTRPHFHPEDRHAIVISGTWWTGEGDTFDPATTVGLKPGSYMKHPARAHHYDGAKDEEVILQIAGYGPSGTTFLDPAAGTTGPSVPGR